VVYGIQNMTEDAQIPAHDLDALGCGAEASRRGVPIKDDDAFLTPLK
jgi:hypothetical protein